MTNAQRAVSALNTGRLAWTGANVSAGVPVALQAGKPELTATAPASLAGTYLIGTASFGPAISSPGVSGEVMPVVDQVNGTGLACNGVVPRQHAGGERQDCPDRSRRVHVRCQTLNAQNAGAIGVIIVDNAAGSPPPDWAGPIRPS